MKDKVGRWILLYLLILIVLAVLGYSITPDSSRFANSQHLEISLKKPGFSCYFYSAKVRTKDTFFYQMLHGSPYFSKEVSLNHYKVENDSLFLYVIDPLLANNQEVISLALPQAHQQEFLKTHIQKKVFYLGSDRFGRDVLSRMIIGLRISLAVGFIAIIISLIIGLSFGLLAGYFGGGVDKLIMWLINVIWSLPSLLLIIAISFALGKGFWQMFLAIGLSMWVEVARVVRGQVLSIKQNEYIEAARALAYSHTRIIIRHILPNIWGPVIVISAANFSTAILVEAGLSFLGLGVAPPIPSLGGMIRESYMGIFFGSPWLSIFPGLLIISLVFSLMLLGRVLKKYL